jgi:hypothetical protein
VKNQSNKRDQSNNKTVVLFFKIELLCVVLFAVVLLFILALTLVERVAVS